MRGCLESIESLNISDNPLYSIPDTINQLMLTMPNVKDLQISLFDEEDVDYILTHMPQLQFLNNLAVDRGIIEQSDLHSSEATAKA